MLLYSFFRCLLDVRTYCWERPRHSVFYGYSVFLTDFLTDFLFISPRRAEWIFTIYFLSPRFFRPLDLFGITPSLSSSSRHALRLRDSFYTKWETTRRRENAPLSTSMKFGGWRNASGNWTPMDPGLWAPMVSQSVYICRIIQHSFDWKKGH